MWYNVWWFIEFLKTYYSQTGSSFPFKLPTLVTTFEYSQGISIDELAIHYSEFWFLKKLMICSQFEYSSIFHYNYYVVCERIWNLLRFFWQYTKLLLFYLQPELKKMYFKLLEGNSPWILDYWYQCCNYWSERNNRFHCNNSCNNFSLSFTGCNNFSLYDINQNRTRAQ